MLLIGVVYDLGICLSDFALDVTVLGLLAVLFLITLGLFVWRNCCFSVASLACFGVLLMVVCVGVFGLCVIVLFYLFVLISLL